MFNLVRRYQAAGKYKFDGVVRRVRGAGDVLGDVIGVGLGVLLVMV